jgi:hypothetical protein
VLTATSSDAATKLLFLVLNRSEKQWIMPPREWSMAKSQFAVLFGELQNGHGLIVSTFQPLKLVEVGDDLVFPLPSGVPSLRLRPRLPR